MNYTIDKIINLLKKKNITEFEIDISKSIGTSTSVRLGELENISGYQNQNLEITVYQNKCIGHASSVDLSTIGIENTINSAINIAKYTQSDKFHSLAPVEKLAFNPPELNMYFPWELSGDQAINIAKECEDSGLSINGISNSDGAEVSSFSGTDWYINSNSLNISRKYSYHSIGCSLIAESIKNGLNDKQTAYKYSTTLDAVDLQSPQAIGKIAAQNTLQKLGGGLIKSGNYPVIFTNKVSGSIISSILSAISGSIQYKKSSFLVDSLGKIIMPNNINIIEKPLMSKTMGAKAFDDDGVLKKEQYFIKNGAVNSYILGQYSANQMQMQTTGNAGGINNIVVPSTKNINLNELNKQMQVAVVVDEIMGQGINIITGDYSVGVSGFLVENGEITKKIAGITIAGNLKQMIKDIDIITNDFDEQKNIKVGSILIKNMVISGS